MGKKKQHKHGKAIQFMRLSHEIEAATKVGWIGYFDGACEPNPGPMGIGALLQRDNMPVDSIALKTGHGTNNVAEYAALIELLKLAEKHSALDVLICGDSMLVLMQVAGHWKVKAEHLQIYRDEAQRRLKLLPGARLAWIPRAYNELADALSKL